MAVTPEIDASQGFLSVVTAGSGDMNLSQAFGIAIINFPSADENISQAFVTIPLTRAADMQISQAWAVAVTNGFVQLPKLGAWTFTLDGHDFYVLQLPAETLVYDFYAERWYVWGSKSLPLWQVQCGINWNADLGEIIATMEGDEISNVICGDGATSALYFLDPELAEDYSSKGNAGQAFTRIITGQLVSRSEDYTSLPQVTVQASDGEDVTAADMSVLLSYSDDRGHNYNLADTLTVTIGDYSPQLQWRSLGSYKSPGRLLRLTDHGALARIDDWTVPDNG